MATNTGAKIMSLPLTDKYFGNLSIKGIVEIALPEDISWLPQTYGWKLLFFFLVSFAVYKTYLYVNTFIKSIPIRKLIKNLEQETKSIEELATIAIVISSKSKRNFEYLKKKPVASHDGSQFKTNEDLLHNYVYSPVKINDEFIEDFRQNLIIWLRGLLWLS